YILMDTFGPGLAWNLFRLYNCDREARLPKMHVSPIKMARHKLRPFLLHRVLRLLGNMSMLSEGQQHKVFSLLKEHVLKARRMPPKPRVEHSGKVVFADRPHGPPITLRARYILIRDGGELHVGSERCPYASRATISLRWGSRGLNLRVLDAGTGRVAAAGRFDTHLRAADRHIARLGYR
ncbi:UNVERIFIED_CONTAM: hypothetical protein H355_007624, partial [Colinus virginianus]